MLYETLSSGETYHQEATDFVYDVARRVKTENGPVSIRDHHNLTWLDNTDNQVPLRYAGHQVRLVDPGIRFDGTRCGQDVIRSRKRLRQSPAIFRRALRKPRLVMVGEGKSKEGSVVGLELNHEIESFDGRRVSLTREVKNLRV